MSNRVIVIGGGPAGMMAAITAASNGAFVTLVEKNEKLGKKLYITGKGRCNLTNNCDREELMRSIVRNGRFMYSCIERFSNIDVQNWFEDAGLRLKVERGERVFPESDKSSDVIRTLERKLEEFGVNRLNGNVEEILTVTSAVTGIRLVSGEVIPADCVIAAVGGASYPSTGSDGSFFGKLIALGHSIEPLEPALVPFETAEAWPKQAQGLSLRNCTFTLFGKNGKKLYTEQGELLFTHFGISGPLVLTASLYSGHVSATEPLKAEIDLKPALSIEQLDRRLLRDFSAEGKRSYGTYVRELLPPSLCPVFVELTAIPEEKLLCSITKEERLRICEKLKHLGLTIVAKRPFEEAIITAGGVRVKEVNPSTMESKLVSGLFFAGELLDVHGKTGGFNLQIAWSTGFTAGASAAEK